jgi:hypothetical protein
MRLGFVNFLIEIEIGDLYEDGGAKIVLMMAVVMEDCGGYGRLWWLWKIVVKLWWFLVVMVVKVVEMWLVMVEREGC